MLWKTHIRISNEVLNRLNIRLSNVVYQRFKEGVIAPDQWQDFPHHYGKTDKIEENLQYARQCFIQDNQSDAFYYLGVAFHYIQDAYTSVVAYKGPESQHWHHNYEQRIEDSNFTYDVSSTIQYFFQDNHYQLNKYMNLANEFSSPIQGKYNTLRAATLVGSTECQQTGKPKVDLNIALKACVAVAESIVSQKNNPQLELSIKQSYERYDDLLSKTEIFCSNDIINYANQVKNLRAKKIEGSGFILKLKNELLSLRVRVKEFQLNHKYDGYVNEKHLEKVNSEYAKEISNITGPHVGWYTYFIPQLDFNSIKKELVPIHQSNDSFGLNQEKVLELIRTRKISGYIIRKQAIVSRREVTMLGLTS